MATWITITHRDTGEQIAQGPKGWGFFPFEGNYYIQAKYLRTEGFSFSGVPGICSYKFLYFWYDLTLANGVVEARVAWKYWLPNPLFPFVVFRIGLPAQDPRLFVSIEERQE